MADGDTALPTVPISELGCPLPCLSSAFSTSKGSNVPHRLSVGLSRSDPLHCSLTPQPRCSAESRCSGNTNSTPRTADFSHLLSAQAGSPLWVLAMAMHPSIPSACCLLPAAFLNHSLWLPDLPLSSKMAHGSCISLGFST